jgi:hypothetical protein
VGYRARRHRERGEAGACGQRWCLPDARAASRSARAHSIAHLFSVPRKGNLHKCQQRPVWSQAENAKSSTIGFFLPCVKISGVERWRFENFPRLPARCAWRPNPAAARKTDRAFHRAANKARHANRKLSNSNSANPSPPRFRALERGDDRAATRAARALKHARRTRKRTEAGDHKRG